MWTDLELLTCDCCLNNIRLWIMGCVVCGIYFSLRLVCCLGTIDFHFYLFIIIFF